MNNRNYIAAFTIVEVVVSMAVTAIILTIIFVIFSITSERLLDFKNQNEYIADLNRMTYSINKGIFESETMLLNENELTFIDYDGDITKYSYRDKYFIREKNKVTDTFKIVIKKINIDTLSSKSKRHMYQRLKCNIEIDHQNMDVDFFKKVYADQLLKAMPKDEF